MSRGMQLLWVRIRSDPRSEVSAPPKTSMRRLLSSSAFADSAFPLPRRRSRMTSYVPRSMLGAVTGWGSVMDDRSWLSAVSCRATCPPDSREPTADSLGLFRYRLLHLQLLVIRHDHARGVLLFLYRQETVGDPGHQGTGGITLSKELVDGFAHADRIDEAVEERAIATDDVDVSRSESGA